MKALTDILDRPERWCRRAPWHLCTHRVVALCLESAIDAATGVGPTIGELIFSVHALTQDLDALDRSTRLHALMLGVIADEGFRDPRTRQPYEHVAWFNDEHGRTFADVHRVCAETDRRLALGDGDDGVTP